LGRPRIAGHRATEHGADRTVSRTVLWLPNRRARNRRVAGGKAAGLCRLAALGFPVPPGFVVPVGAMEEWGAGRRKEVWRAASRLRQPLVVRSSLVGEDDVRWSFAGQLETVLGVEGEEDFFRAMEVVKASASRLRLQRYGEVQAEVELPGALGEGEVAAVTLGQPAETPDDAGSPGGTAGVVGRLAGSSAGTVGGVGRLAGSPGGTAGVVGRLAGSSAPTPGALGMAILVQEMVPARAAGVAFSHDPITGRSTAVLEAVPRLGQELVQGRAAPDRFVVDPRGVLLLEERMRLGEEDLPTEVVLTVASMARLAADRFGFPQDMEWAWDGANVFLLQSRPITSLAGKSVYSRKLVGDMTPGPIKHLVWSTNTLGMVEGVFGEVFTCLIGKNSYDFKRILKRIRSRAYVDTTFVGELLADVGLPRNLFEAIAREERVSRRVRLNPKLLSRAPGILAFVWKYARMEGELDAVLQRHGKELDRFRKADWSGEPASQLLARAEELLALHRHLQRCIMFGSMNLAIRTRLLKRFVARQAPDLDASQLLLGLRGLKSLEPNRALQVVAMGTATLEDELMELLHSGRDQAIREALEKHPGGAALLGEVDLFLERFGFLSANGTNFGEPTWAEDPTPLWMALGRMMREEPRPTKDSGALREDARRRVLARLGPVQRRLFLARLGSAARYLELREGISLLMTEDTYELRRLFLALGRQLVETGGLRDPEDVFFLYLQELRDLVKGGQPVDEPETRFHRGMLVEELPGLAHPAMSPDALQTLVLERKAEIEADRDVELPETILGEEIPSTVPEPEDAHILTGIAASRGMIRGTARVVRELSDAPARLSAADVLVVPFSDVGWTPLFASVGGIVAECGGQLSHTAIVAREYGLPAVVGVRNALNHIRNGQTVTVDGGTGRVYLEEDGMS
jgi:phosphohistidine swiveling domain-containing protein